MSFFGAWQINVDILNNLLLREHDGSFDYMLQFSYVSRPIIAQKLFRGSRAQVLTCFPPSALYLAKKCRASNGISLYVAEAAVRSEE